VPTVIDQALLLKRVDYSESDRIATLFTLGQGKLAVMAKGARSSRSRFGPGGLEPFRSFEATFEVDPRRELAVLKGVARGRSWPGLLADLDSLAAGWRILELVDAFKQPHQAEPALFELILQAFARLDRGYSPAHRLWFEARLLELEGLATAEVLAWADAFEGGAGREAWGRAADQLDRLFTFHLGKALKTTGLDRQFKEQP
jgi:DNA repair protein RecO (recombination protein O)